MNLNGLGADTGCQCGWAVSTMPGAQRTNSKVNMSTGMDVISAALNITIPGLQAFESQDFLPLAFLVFRFSVLDWELNH